VVIAVELTLQAERSIRSDLSLNGYQEI